MDSNGLREKRTNTVINTKSKIQEKSFHEVVKDVIGDVEKSSNVELIWKKRLYLKEIANNVPSGTCISDKSFISPDGGFVFLCLNGKTYPVFIGEVKRQGTNDLRLLEGKGTQSKGNAIERLGKNVIALQAWMWNEDIFPFVCFGYGCDFREGSTILDRVITINLLGKLNTVNILREEHRLQRASYFFREEKWTHKEMYDIIYHVITFSINFYLGKYGK